MEADDTLEHKALRNTRALIDRLETDERTRRQRQKRALWIIGIAALVLVAFAVNMALMNPKETPAEKRQRDCRIDAWSARMGEATERIRAENPGMPYREIAKKLKQEQDAFMATAKGACENPAAPPGK